MAAPIDITFRITWPKWLWLKWFYAVYSKESAIKISSHRQIASDTFILKIALVSELQRHNTEN